LIYYIATMNCEHFVLSRRKADVVCRKPKDGRLHEIMYNVLVMKDMKVERNNNECKGIVLSLGSSALPSTFTLLFLRRESDQKGKETLAVMDT
jgi:hypothetical protein